MFNKWVEGESAIIVRGVVKTKRGTIQTYSWYLNQEQVRETYAVIERRDVFGEYLGAQYTAASSKICFFRDL